MEYTHLSTGYYMPISNPSLPRYNRYPFFIGLSGHFHSGKDTATEVLEKLFLDSKVPAARFAFASTLKKFAANYFGWDGNKEPDYDFPIKDSNKSAKLIGGRTLLQGLGVFARDHISQDFWVQQTFSNIFEWGLRQDPTKRPVAIITDARFLNEAKRIKDHEGFLIYVKRPGFDGDAHISETSMDTPEFQTLITYKLQNLKTLEDFIHTYLPQFFSQTLYPLYTKSRDLVW